MSSITYNGQSLADYVSAELIELAAHTLNATTALVPGRAGLVVLHNDVQPLDLGVRVFLDAPEALTVAQRTELRAALRGWLLSTDGGELVVPGEPTLSWHDAYLVGVNSWDSLWNDGEALLTFRCFDPIAYGNHVAVLNPDLTFTLGGTWPTWPIITLEVADAATLTLYEYTTGAYIEIDHEMYGAIVTIDCEDQTVTVDGEDATADVTLGSDFFQLWPGDVEFVLSGTAGDSGTASGDADFSATMTSITYYERWA